MNEEQSKEIINLLKEHNDLQRHRNAQLTALHNKIDDVKHELSLIRGYM